LLLQNKNLTINWEEQLEQAFKMEKDRELVEVSNELKMIESFNNSCAAESRIYSY
jgi:hypothetical protein